MNATSSSTLRKPTAVGGGIAVGSLGTLVFALIGHDWSVAIAVGTTVAPGALGYLVTHGGLKGVLESLWDGTGDDAPARTA